MSGTSRALIQITRKRHFPSQFAHHDRHYIWHTSQITSMLFFLTQWHTKSLHCYSRLVQLVQWLGYGPNDPFFKSRQGQEIYFSTKTQGDQLRGTPSPLSSIYWRLFPLG